MESFQPGLNFSPVNRAEIASRLHGQFEPGLIYIEKTMKKIFKKKIISDLPTPIFSRYETGTTGFFFTP